MPTTYEPIATTTLGSSANITFSSIPSTYTDLVIVITGTASAANNSNAILFNGDTWGNSSLYSLTFMSGYPTAGVGVESSRRTSYSGIVTNPTTTNSSSVPYMQKITIFSYRSSFFKTVLAEQHSNFNGSSGGVTFTAGSWRSTSAITSVTVAVADSTYNSGTIATLFGIKAA